MSADSGQIVTVDGRLDPDELGVTLPHEHSFFDAADAWFSAPETEPGNTFAYQQVRLENLWWIRRNPFGNADNMRVQSLEEAVFEFQRFADAGGCTVVDVTPKNVGGDPTRVRTLARRTGLNFVHGTGFYTQPTHPVDLSTRTIEDLTAELVSEVCDGIDDSDVRAGIIGEIGLSERIHDDEEKVLRAAARAARQTGAPLSIHPPGKTKYSQRERTYPSSRWGLEILDIIEAEGLAPNRVILSHMDRSLFADLSYQKELARRGAFLEYDLWGRMEYFVSLEDGYPGDVWRAQAVAELIEDGYLEHILLSHDIAQKSTRATYGGHGYDHLLEAGIPLLTHYGVREPDLERLFVENPRRILTFDPPK